jgi:hypothetical protein
VPYDIPIEAFAVEVGGGAHPAVRSLGDRRSVYVEHRRALRRAYRRRQLFFAVGLSGAFVVVAAVALAPSGHASASVAGPEGPVVSHPGVPSGAAGSTAGSGANPAASGGRPVEPAFVPARRSARPSSSPSGSRQQGPTNRPPEDRDELRHAANGRASGSGLLAEDPFLVCTRGYESIYAGGYGAIGGGGRYFGAYQFDQVTWNGTARHLGRFDLVGVRPDDAPPAVQDFLAYELYEWQGAGHWHDRCTGLP